MKQHPIVLSVLSGVLAASALAGCGEGQVESNDQALRSVPFEQFEGGVQSWLPFNDPQSTVSVAAIDSPARQGKAMHLGYSIARGGFAGVERTTPTGWDWVGVSALQIHAHRAAAGEGLTVQVYDSGWERWEAELPRDWSGWRDMTLPVAALNPAADQPWTARANGKLDLSAVKGVAFVPKGAGTSGTVTIDSVSVLQKAQAAGGQGTTPAGSEGANAAGGDQPAAPAASDTTVLVPLYTPPGHPSWAAVLEAKSAHPRVPVIAVVNPANGPGAAKSDAYASAIAQLRAAGVRVFAYVFTSYGARNADEVEADMAQWRAWYPEIDGVFFDEMMNQAGYEEHYRSLTARAKALGYTTTIGNPGQDTTPAYVGTVDTIVIYESYGVPAADRLGGWHGDYPREAFALLAHTTGMDASFVAQARKNVGMLYLTDDSMPNPWDSVPGYLSELFAALE